MCRESFDKQKLPQTLREGVLILIPKVGKRKDDIQGYRPITLLNTGYKIISATIARRLKGVLTSIIGPEQTGFVPGRFIGSAIRLTYDVIHSVKEKGSEGLLVSLDMDNAFNAVEWSWIQASLASRGFPQCIIQWFLTLYNESFSRLTYNGHISEPIPLSRYARQGDPISGYLFIIALEHLLDRIRANENIKGIKIGTTEVKLSAYADDVLCLLDGNPNSLRQLFAELGIFAKFSGLKPNIEKTSAMRIGKTDTDTQGYGEIPIRLTDKIKLLGIVFSNNLDEITKSNYEPNINDLEKISNQWQKRQLSLIGKITVLKALWLSKLTYCLTSLPQPSDEMVSRINELMFKFIWNGKRDRIKREILTQPHALGGQGMTDIRLFIIALKVTWVKRYFTSSHPWTLIADHLLFLSETSCVWDKGSIFVKQLSEKINNQFWKEVLTSWSLYIRTFKLEDVTMGCISLWKSDYTKYTTSEISQWVRSGVTHFNDLRKPSGKLMSYLEAKEKYKLKGTFLDYEGLLSSLPREYITSKEIIETPFIADQISHLFKDKSGARNIYNRLTRAPLGYFYNAPHWGGGGLFRAPPLISETTGPILKIQTAFESPGKTVEGKQILLTSGSRVTSQVRSKSKCSTFRAW